MGAFSENAEAYAAKGIATFPVRITAGGDKRPAVRGWQRLGLAASGILAKRFPDADALGFVAGRRNGLTVLDVDSPDERVLADAIGHHGETPLLVRTGRGHFQAWYRHGGECRHIRPLDGKPIDILGAGLVVAPPSVAGRNRYQIIQGSLEDLDRLPTMRLASVRTTDTGSAVEGTRNRTLFTFCGRAAHGCASFDELLALARNEAACYLPPMDDAEIVKTAHSIWRYREQGRLRLGTHGAWFDTEAATRLARDPPLFALVAYLQAINGPNATFWIADGLQKKLQWSRREFSGARRRLIQQGLAHCIQGRAPGRPALYRWGRAPSRTPSEPG